ncbi:cupin-like domain-containing protein [Sphingomonas sp. MA1305]|uniref:cupin-like domain-containing protein n=1 Tax=Sphingomonas sp. MA1305 TaxID=2479204 RepID=UPI002FCCBBD0
MARDDASPLRVTRRTREIDGRGMAPDLAAIVEAGVPTILRGAVAHWPLVAAGRDGPEAVADYLARFDGGRPLVAYLGGPAIRGRFHYDRASTGMNFRTERLPLPMVMARLAEGQRSDDGAALYVGSTDLDHFFPGLRLDNPLAPADDLFVAHPPLASIWIGNRTVAAAHHDMSDNAAACAVGRRRFTLFPPEQIANLYPGPLEPTPGGQAVTMVDFAAPDLDLYPRFAEAVAAGEIAELEPGDLLVYPALWWHQVEALDPFNVLVNFWWNRVADHHDTPMTTLLHALLALRDRPAHEKRGWQALFDYYVFGPADAAAAHLPPAMQGPLGPIDADLARRLRGAVAHRLNR